jgi:tetratricopeptide (TPR) repeat protein
MLPMREQTPAGHKPHKKEDLAFEIAFFEGIARRDPDYIEALQVLGDAYTKTGQWEKGLLVDQRLARLCPENPLVFYNLACSYSLMKSIDEAFAALDRAVQLGYNDARWLAKDPDLENLRHDSRFETIRLHLRKRGHNPSRD